MISYFFQYWYRYLYCKIKKLKYMKKFILLLFSVFLIHTTAKADDERLIKFAELPQNAQTFVQKYFKRDAVALVKMESDFFDKSYEIIFTNGDKVEFNKSGDWEEVDCRYTELPVAIIPTAIQNYVKKNYPDSKIMKIERKRRGEIEVNLSNRLELTFDSTFNLIDIDN